MKTYLYIKQYKTLRQLCLWACTFALIQSLIGITLNVVGILIYYNIITTKKTTVLHISQNNVTILNEQQIFIFNCIFVAINLCWLIISFTILKNIKNTSKLHIAKIIVWLLVSLISCILRLILDIIFAIDYTHSVQSKEGDISASMISLISEGVILWLINMAYVLRICEQLRKINRKNGDMAKLFTTSNISSNDSNQAVINRDQLDHQQQSQHQNDQRNDIMSTAFNNDGFESDTTSYSNKTMPQPSPSNNANNSNCIQIDKETLMRTAHLSKEVDSLVKYFYNINLHVVKLPLNDFARSNNFENDSTSSISAATTLTTTTTTTTATNYYSKQ